MGWLPTSPWRPIAGTGQNVTIGAASVQSTAFSDNCRAIIISGIGGACHVALGMNPTATGADMLISQNDPPFVMAVNPGEKLAVIRDGTAAGTLNIIEATH
jgi:hypothetical protein